MKRHLSFLLRLLVVSLPKESKRILEYYETKINKCLFSYLYNLTFIVKSFKVEKWKRTNNNTSNESRRPSVVVNNHPQNEHFYWTSVSDNKSSNRKKRNIIFRNDIRCGIQLHEVSYWLYKKFVHWNLFLMVYLKNFYTMSNQHWKIENILRLYFLLVLMTYLMMKSKTLFKTTWILI